MMDHLRPAAPSGPVLRPVESLTGRGKVTLAPGHSLMDWIRLGREKGDLSGVGTKKREVTIAELATHNTERDMWMAIRGKVYNITHYLDFHPGGVTELMRAAGDDGTNLFDEIHNWVNAESMLTKCYIGPLVAARGEATSRTLPKSISMKQRQSLVSLQSRRASDCPEPSYDWYQTSEEVCIVVYTRRPELKSEQVIIDITPSDVLIEVLIRDNSFYVHFKPHGRVDDNCTVNVAGEKAEIRLKKKQDNSHWPSMGNKLGMDKSFIRTKYTEPKYRQWTLTSNLPVSHDTRILALKPPPGTRILVPIGYHFHVHHKVKGMELARSYTVGLPSLLTEEQDPATLAGKMIHFMIKGYPGGAISPWIISLKPGDKLKLDRFHGSFTLQKVHNASHLIMFVAGTGFTSIIRLIYYVLNEMPNSTIKLHLIFYNKSPEDILWRDQLDYLEKANENRFSVTHILSRTNSKVWKGLTGRVTLEHVKKYVPEPQLLDNIKPLVCICGMHAFNDAVESFAKQHGVGDEHIHIFTQSK